MLDLIFYSLRMTLSYQASSCKIASKHVYRFGQHNIILMALVLRKIDLQISPENLLLICCFGLNPKMGVQIRANLLSG
jgi:hypothetical protein